MAKKANTILGVKIPQDSRESILEKVASWVGQTGDMRHVVSLNPEILVLAQYDEEFRLILQSADAHLVDGFGVVLASKIRGISIGQRFTGVDFMEALLAKLGIGSSRVLFLGGTGNLAADLAKCYENKYPSMRFSGLSGIKDIKKYQSDQEGTLIMKEVAVFKPHIIFGAFGSPFQEKFFWEHRAELKNTICIGVGGAFDFVGGNVARAPAWMRSIGLEWAFRLAVQPWRWRRQLRLLEFMRLVLQGK